MRWSHGALFAEVAVAPFWCISGVLPLGLSARHRADARFQRPYRRLPPHPAEDRGLTWANLAVLFTNGLLPFPTAIVTDGGSQDD